MSKWLLRDEAGHSMGHCIDVYLCHIYCFIQLDQDDYVRRMTVILGSCNHGCCHERVNKFHNHILR